MKIECPYHVDCKQELDEVRCNKEYDRCIVYQRLKVLDKSGRAKTGLERFVDKYGEDWRQLGVGS